MEGGPKELRSWLSSAEEGAPQGRATWGRRSGAWVPGIPPGREAWRRGRVSQHPWSLRPPGAWGPARAPASAEPLPCLCEPLCRKLASYLVSKDPFCYLGKGFR